MATLFRFAPHCSRLARYLAVSCPSRPFLTPLGGGGTQCRFFFYKILTFFNPPDRQLKLNDGVASHYQIIYKAMSLNYVRYADAFTTGILGGLLVVVPSKKLFLGGPIFLPLAVDNPALIVFATFFITASYVVIYLTARHYVHRIYYSEEHDQYIFVVKGWYPLAQRKLVLSPGDVSVSRGRRVAHFLQPLIGDLYQTKAGTFILINKLRFSVPVYYHKLLGPSL